MLDKNDEVLKYGFKELELCRKAGVRMAKNDAAFQEWWNKSFKG